MEKVTDASFFARLEVAVTRTRHKTASSSGAFSARAHAEDMEIFREDKTGQYITNPVLEVIDVLASHAYDKGLILSEFVQLSQALQYYQENQ